MHVSIGKDLSEQLLLACCHNKLDALRVLLSHSGQALQINTLLPCGGGGGGGGGGGEDEGGSVDGDDGDSCVPQNKDKIKLTALGVAAILGHSSACEALLKAGANVNQDPVVIVENGGSGISGGGGGDVGGGSVLHWAVMAGHLAVVKSLVANGARQSMMDSKVS